MLYPLMRKIKLPFRASDLLLTVIITHKIKLTEAPNE